MDKTRYHEDNAGALSSPLSQPASRLHSFGTHLRALRNQRNISQRNLASQVGINFTYISKIEHGVMPPPCELTIRHIAQVLAVGEQKLPDDIYRQMLEIAHASTTNMETNS